MPEPESQRPICPWHSAHGKPEVVAVETALLIADYTPGNKPPPWTWGDEERLIRSLMCCCEGCPCGGSGPAGWYQSQIEQDMLLAGRWIGPPAAVGADNIVRDGHHRVLAALRTGVSHVEMTRANWPLWWQQSTMFDRGAYPTEAQR